MKMQSTMHGELIDQHTLRFERLLPGPIERVWDYLTKAELRAKWFADGEMEPKNGSALTLVWRNDELGARPGSPPEHMKGFGGTHQSQNVVLAWEPPHRLVFDWSDGIDNGRSQVEFLLEAEGDKVRLTLTHSRLNKSDNRYKFASGWHIHLLMLTELLTGDVKSIFWESFDGVQQSYAKHFEGK